MNWGNSVSKEERSEEKRSEEVLEAESQQAFDELRGVAESISPDDRVRHEPPDDLWGRIASNLAEPNRDLGPAKELPGGDPRFSPRFVLVAAAALIAVLIGASLAIAGTGGDSFVTYAAEITNADLPEAFDGTGTVTLEVDDDPMLVVEFGTEIQSDDNVGIWILSADGTEIIPVGNVEPGDTSWDWPEGFNPQQYPIVDISIEPDDGDPTHSGRSILRGQLAVVS